MGKVRRQPRTARKKPPRATPKQIEAIRGLSVGMEVAEEYFPLERLSQAKATRLLNALADGRVSDRNTRRDALDFRTAGSFEGGKRR